MSGLTRNQWIGVWSVVAVLVAALITAGATLAAGSGGGTEINNDCPGAAAQCTGNGDNNRTESDER